MQKTIERTKLILTLSNHALDLKLANEHSADLLYERMADLEVLEVPKTYSGHAAVQREFLKRRPFIEYYRQLCNAGIEAIKVERLLKELSEKDEAITDFEFDAVKRTLEQGDLPKFYDYLKFFGSLALDLETNEILVWNLNCYYRAKNEFGDELTDNAKSLFLKPYLYHSDLIPERSVNRAFEMLVSDDSLRNIVHMLYENKTPIALDITHYEKIAQKSSVIYRDLSTMFQTLQENNEIFNMLVEQWVNNGCEAYDIEVLKSKTPLFALDELANGFKTRSGYINLLFSGRIRNIQLSSAPAHLEDLLVYAITNNKTHFIQLVEENHLLFESISKNSVLFSKEFYTKHVNINSMSLQNLKDCATMTLTARQWDIGILGDAQYTFEELKALYGLPKRYADLYNQLTIPKVDSKLIVLKQLAKRTLLTGMIGDNDVSALAGKLSQKPLSRWLETDLAHIKQISYNDAIQLLINYDKLESLVSELSDRIETLFILRNIDSVQNLNSVKEIKTKLMAIDKSWCTLRGKMQLTDEFVDLYKDSIDSFLLQDGANIALTYLNGLAGKVQKESFQKIIKAELMGKLSTLKYFKDDLIREINYPISGRQKDLWVNNTEIAESNLVIRECDDFYNTMQMGREPQRTCLSYIDGIYKECLLSCFDSNKKIIYAYLNGKIVGRAILRLTKGSFRDLNKQADASLSFVDLDNIPIESDTDYGTGEHLTIFLEKSYTAHVPPKVGHL